MNFTVRDLINALVGLPADAPVMVDFHRDGPCMRLQVDKVSEGTRADIAEEDQTDLSPVVWIQVSRAEKPECEVCGAPSLAKINKVWLCSNCM